VVDLLPRSVAPGGAKGVKSAVCTKGTGSARGFVDYSTLEVRHLDLIYEGLLEYRLAVLGSLGTGAASSGFLLAFR